MLFETIAEEVKITIINKLTEEIQQQNDTAIINLTYDKTAPRKQR